MRGDQKKGGNGFELAKSSSCRGKGLGGRYGVVLSREGARRLALPHPSYCVYLLQFYYWLWGGSLAPVLVPISSASSTRRRKSTIRRGEKAGLRCR